MDVREKYTAAVVSFAELLTRVPLSAYDGPGLGDWDLRALVGHTSRALLTVQTYLDRPAAVAEVGSAAEYVAKAVGVATDPGAVLDRGRVAGAALGADPAAFVRTLGADVVAKVAGFDLDYVLETVAGAMRLGDYLPTRTFELVVHGLDVGRATGTDPAYPDEVLADAASLAAQVAVRTGRGPDLLLALTGRAPLPAGFSVV
jgi:Mycothiol maleylpyruvate isomerase N-terminal domain